MPRQTKAADCVRVGVFIGLDAKARDLGFGTHRDRGVFQPVDGPVYASAPLTKALHDHAVTATVEVSPKFSDIASLKALYREKFLGVVAAET